MSRQRARCTRCEAVLYRGTSVSGGTGARHGRAGLSRMAAIALTALLVYLIAQFFPIVELDLNGSSTSATLLGAIRILWREDMEVVATMVFLSTILFPVLELCALLYLISGLHAGQKRPAFNRLLRMVQALRHWGMIEVLMIGILITVIKMTSLASVLFHPGLFGFAALTLLMAMVVRIEPRDLWNIGDQLVSDSQPVERRHTYSSAGSFNHASQPNQPNNANHASHALVACGACGLLNSLADARRGKHYCSRCSHVLHQRRPDSIRRTWALLSAAAILYVPAMALPVMYTTTLFGREDDTILSGVALFWNSGSKGLAAIIFIASIVVPMAKLAALTILAASTQGRSLWRPLQRTVLYRLVEFVGRWSMLDIFVITLTVALVRFQSLAVITAGPGALAFGAVVVLTMLASMQFDPRLIWDPIKSSGEQHV